MPKVKTLCIFHGLVNQKLSLFDIGSVCLLVFFLASRRVKQEFNFDLWKLFEEKIPSQLFIQTLKKKSSEWKFKGVLFLAEDEKEWWSRAANSCRKKSLCFSKPYCTFLQRKWSFESAPNDLIFYLEFCQGFTLNCQKQFWSKRGEG